MKIEQLMTRDVKTSQPQESLNRAAQLMWECDVGCIPVVDESNRVVGMITDRDIAMATYLQGLPPGAITLESVTSKKVYTCKPEEDVSVAAQRMQRHRVRRLPVIDAKGRLVGLISLNDIAIEAERKKDARKPEVALVDVALTLAELCQHRAAEALAAQ
jgi:CBS domain-containing protein